MKYTTAASKQQTPPPWETSARHYHRDRNREAIEHRLREIGGDTNAKANPPQNNRNASPETRSGSLVPRMWPSKEEPWRTPKRKSFEEMTNDWEMYPKTSQNQHLKPGDRHQCSKAHTTFGDQTTKWQLSVATSRAFALAGTATSTTRTRRTRRSTATNLFVKLGVQFLSSDWQTNQLLFMAFLYFSETLLWPRQRFQLNGQRHFGVQHLWFLLQAREWHI
jgi:hypothetical protein